MPIAQTKTLNLRIETDVLQEVKAAATQHHISANRFIVDAITASLRALRDKEWRKGFEAMGQDPDVCDVDYMIPAAREVLLGDQ